MHVSMPVSVISEAGKVLPIEEHRLRMILVNVITLINALYDIVCSLCNVTVFSGIYAFPFFTCA